MNNTAKMSPSVAAVVSDYQSWVRETAETHADLLEQANSLIVEHGFQPYSDVIVDAVAAFKAELAAKATDRDPDADPDVMAQQIEEWSRLNVSEAGQDAVLMAAIYGKGSYDLEFALEDNTPEQPSI